MLRFIARTIAKPIERIFEKRAEGATAQFRDHVRQVRSRTQPLKIELVASTDTVWLETPAARQVTQFLSGLGFAPDLLINAYWCATDNFKAKDTDFAAGGPREAFGRVASSRGARLRKVYQKWTPLEADFYLPE